jgi:hypothetical protein
MDRLSIVLTLMTGAVLTGGLVVAAFSLGWYGWPPILGAAAIGFAASWPVALTISRRIKRADPSWDETRIDRVPDTIPRPGAPEF